ncbi:enoyl-CoA hydratase/isomerase family protein, partial [Nocardioides hankookensis]
MTDAPVLLEVTDGVATITLNRPKAYNSLNIETKVLLRDTIRQVADDPDVRCVVLTGSGKAFCTGQDLKEHIELLENGGSDALFTTVDEHYNPTVTALAGMAKPVIAAVNGVAAGAGSSLAFACDLRIVADTAGFNLAFANVALSCDTGASYHLQQLVGRAKAIELLYFPRTISAADALELGLATKV